MAASKLNPQEIASLVSEGCVLAKKVAGLKESVDRLEVIKGILRDEARGRGVQFSGAEGEAATVTAVADTVARAVPEELVAKAKELAGRAWCKLFRLSPVGKFKEEATRLLKDKNKAHELVGLLMVPSSARVTFAPAAKK